MRVSFRRIDSRETIQPWRGGKPETAENRVLALFTGSAKPCTGPHPTQMDPPFRSLAWVEAGPVWTHMKEEVVHWFAGSTRENHGGRGSQTLRIEAAATGGGRRP